MNQADVAVLILTYNDPVYIKSAVASVLKQTYTRLRIKILDNGSTDETPRSLTEFSQDPRVTILRNPVNQRSEFGARQAMAVDEKYFCFLFSDDLFHPKRIEKMHAVLESDPEAAAVFSNCGFVDGDDQPLSAPPTGFDGDVSKFSADEHLHHFLFSGNTLHPCAMLVRTSEYRRIGGFKPYLHRIGDMEFFVRLLSQTKVLFMPDVLQRIRIFSNGRNESAANLENPLAVALERTQFLESYRQHAALDRLERIIPEWEKRLKDPSRPARQFWLGRRLFEIPTLDHQLFAIRCMYEAYEADPTLIDALCQKELRNSFAQHMHELQNAGVLRESLQVLTNLWIKRMLTRMPGGLNTISALRKLRTTLGGEKT